MANPPFNLDIADPTDGSLGNAFPANERTFRDNVNSYLNTEHDINTGHHALPLLTTAQRNALSTPPAGMPVYVTDATPPSLYINTGTPGAPVWTPVPQQGDRGSAIVAAGSGTFTIAVPNLKVTGVGGGGGGGGGAASTGAGGAGGSGSWFIAFFTGLTVGNTLTYTVGVGGSAGAAGVGGGAGGQTQIASGTQTITTRTAPAGSGGGAGSTSANGSPGSQGGTATGAAGDLLGQGIPGTIVPVGAGAPGSVSFMVPFGVGGAGGSINSAGLVGGSGSLLFEWVQ